MTVPLPPLTLIPIGWVHSPLTDLDAAPLQGDEGAPEAWIEIVLEFEPALLGLDVGDDIVLVTWLHHAARDVLSTHPRNDPTRPELGVFATRSPHRPNPIGLHPTRIIAIEPGKLHVAPLEAIDGTPVLDIKPILTHTAGR